MSNRLKGMNLEAFRVTLESEATKRAEAQEKTIAELREALKLKSEENAILREAARVLSNRCRANHGGVLCHACRGPARAQCRAGEVERG